MMDELWRAAKGVPGIQRHAAVYKVSDLSKAIPTNTAASAKQRLLNQARAQKAAKD